MNCPYCDNPVSALSSQCDFCGASLPTSQTKATASLSKVILSTCRRHSTDGSGLYVSPNIPWKKEYNLRQSVFQTGPIANDTHVLALIDATIFGSAKNGMLITPLGLYIHNDWTASTTGNFFIPWSELLQARASNYPHKKITEIVLTPTVALDLSGSNMSVLSAMDLIHDLQYAITTSLNTSQQQAASQSTTRRCQYCDREIAAPDTACPSCGAPL